MNIYLLDYDISISRDMHITAVSKNTRGFFLLNLYLIKVYLREMIYIYLK